MLVQFINSIKYFHQVIILYFNLKDYISKLNKYLLKDMHKTGPLDKISQILVYSQNYCSHLKNLQHVKSAVDQSTRKRNAYNCKLHKQHAKYVQAVQKQKNKQLIKQNNKVVNRILQIQKKSSKKIIMHQNLSDSRNSITSKSFDNLMISKNRFRARKNKEIQIQNMKITNRITSSRNKESFSRKSCQRQSNQVKKDLSLLGRYSQRSQSVLSDLISKNLKLKYENIPFLPQIISKNIMKNKNRSLNRQRQQNQVQNIEEIDKSLLQNTNRACNKSQKLCLTNNQHKNLQLKKQKTFVF